MNNAPGLSVPLRDAMSINLAVIFIFLLVFCALMSLPDDVQGSLSRLCFCEGH